MKILNMYLENNTCTITVQYLQTQYVMSLTLLTALKQLLKDFD